MDENSQNPLTAQPEIPEIEPSKNLSPKLIPILLVATFFALAGIAFLFLNSKLLPPIKTSQTKLTSIQPTTEMKSPVGVTGKLQKLSDDLGLIQTTVQNDPSNSVQTTYYSAGVYADGSFKDYKRYIVVTAGGGPDGPLVYIVASKDNKKYVLDGDPQDEKLQDAAGNNPYSIINKSKISKITPLDTSHPQIIQLNSHFALNKRSTIAKTTSDNTGKKSKEGYEIYDSKSFLITDFSAYTPLKSPNPRLTFFAGKRQDRYNDPKTTPTPAIEDNYIKGSSQIIAVDSTGLAYAYDLTSPNQATEYPSKMDAYNKALAEMTKTNSTKYPDYPGQPNLHLEKSGIQTSEQTYNKYDIAIPVACASDGNTVAIKNVGDQDLHKIGTTLYGDIYSLTDKNHPLNKAAYDNKMKYYDEKTNPGLYQEMNHSKKPTLDEYISKNPLLFFKDFWGRWVALGEYDLQLPGGCGKPVVYLYPIKPTEVSVKFLTPITFDVTMPNYKNGWKVLASPDGTLKDLQPESTDCDKINVLRRGSAYAKNACESNQYPYLYWAGQSTEKQYPAVDKGWIVESKNLSAFLNQKLDGVGFNKKEKSDFLEYWLPEMQSKNANYYRISFLQTQEMNYIAPMQILPTPKSVYRLFLDYSAYADKPSEIEPQNLFKIHRDGFTVVEWGGLKGISVK